MFVNLPEVSMPLGELSHQLWQDTGVWDFCMTLAWPPVLFPHPNLTASPEPPTVGSWEQTGSCSIMSVYISRLKVKGSRVIPLLESHLQMALCARTNFPPPITSFPVLVFSVTCVTLWHSVFIFPPHPLLGCERQWYRGLWLLSLALSPKPSIY